MASVLKEGMVLADLLSHLFAAGDVPEGQLVVVTVVLQIWQCHGPLCHAVVHLVVVHLVCPWIISSTWVVVEQQPEVDPMLRI